MPRLLLIGMALALGIGLVYLIFVRELPRTEEQAQAIAQQTLDMSNVVMKQQRGEQIEWVVTSDRATYNETLRRAEGTRIRWTCRGRRMPPSSIRKAIGSFCRERPIS
jgi:uncharacterized protein HemX